MDLRNLEICCVSFCREGDFLLGGVFLLIQQILARPGTEYYPDPGTDRARFFFVQMNFLSIWVFP